MTCYPTISSVEDATEITLDKPLLEFIGKL